MHLRPRPPLPEKHHPYPYGSIVPSIADESGIRPPKKSSYGRWHLTLSVYLSDKKSAKIDKITEKRQFPMDFFCETVDQLRSHRPYGGFLLNVS